VASFYASSAHSGDGVIKVTATYANGKKDASFIKVKVNNPTDHRHF
jgi:hypothetical protein